MHPFVLMLVIGLVLQTQANAQEKSPALAFGLSLGSTALGYGLFTRGFSEDLYKKPKRSSALLTVGLTGMIIGPSMGHLFAGKFGHAAISPQVFAWGSLFLRCLRLRSA